MLVLVTYDITNNRNRTRLAKILSGKGRRVQYSVFECRMESSQLAGFAKSLKPFVHSEDDDSIRIYPLNKIAAESIIVIGQGEVYNTEQLIIY